MRDPAAADTASHRSSSPARAGLALAIAATLAGCPPPAPPAEVDGGAPDVPAIDAPGTDAPPPACTTDAACDDGRFCNGVEACEPGASAADARGCVPDADGTPCLPGQACDEAMDRCGTVCAVTEDADGDGARAPECGGDDCDDADPLRAPGRLEICDAADRDEDCDGSTYGVRDLDGDGLGDAACCNGTTCGTDCDDLRRGTSPGASEVCNALDDDCDGMIDEGVLVPTYPDRDFDLHGDAGAPAEMHCAGTFGFAIVPDDCDDAAPDVHSAQVEICDGRDNDCDGRIDEAPAAVTWYLDGDGDGFGASDPTTTRVSCTPLPGYALRATDCDDTRAGVSPATPERCDGLDNDCSGRPDFMVGRNDTEDDDLDGVADLACPSGTDCDDRDPTSAPEALEICDGRDNDCNGAVDDGTAMGRWMIDRDGDTFGDAGATPVTSCDPVRGHALRAGDCDDSSDARRPGARELCDGVDDDCDGTIDEGSPRAPYYRDADGDGLGAGEPVLACVRPIDRVANASDCDDTMRTVGAARLYFVDADGDTWGDPLRSELSCATLADRVSRGGDCDDTAAAVRPMGTEVCGGGDEDCDATVDEDPAASASCVVSGGTGACVAGACTVATCSAGRADCSGGTADGCETATATDPANCGMCGRACASGERCRDGACARAIALAGGQAHVCALLGTGRVACWGQGSSGELGRGTTSAGTPPASTSEMVQLYTGAVLDDAIDIDSHPLARFTCAVRAGGTVVCWGENDVGQCGADAPAARSLRAATVPGITSAVDVEVGANHACARLTTGAVMCWGSNSGGQLSTGSTTPASTGAPVPAMESEGGGPRPITDAIAMSAGREFTCFVHTGGTRVSCAGREGVGSGARGTLGRGSITTGLYPLADDVLLPGGSVVVDIASGGGYYEGSTVVVLESGAVLGWGISGGQELGASSALTPRPIDALLFASADRVWVGYYSVFVAYDNASFGPRVAALGTNTYGELGLGPGAPSTVSVPFDVQTTPAGFLTDVTDVVNAAGWSCVLLTSGSVSCLGSNSGVFGDGTSAARNTVLLGTTVPRIP